MGTGTTVETVSGARQPRYQRRYRYRSGSPYWKSVRRSFQGTFSRWLAVFAIIGLGAGVFAGLRSVAPDMYASADRLYDRTNFADLRVTSTAGLTADDVHALQQLPGVRNAQPQISTEGSIVTGDAVHDAAILSIDLAAVERGRDAEPINRPVILEGWLPTVPTRCCCPAA